MGRFIWDALYGTFHHFHEAPHLVEVRLDRPDRPARGVRGEMRRAERAPSVGGGPPRLGRRVGRAYPALDAERAGIASRFAQVAPQGIELRLQLVVGIAERHPALAVFRRPPERGVAAPAEPDRDRALEGRR